MPEDAQETQLLDTEQQTSSATEKEKAEPGNRAAIHTAACHLGRI